MKLKIGNKLRSIREAMNIKQDQMAEMLNMAESTYGRYERNETQMDMEGLLKVSEILKVPVQEFLPDTFHIHTNNSGNGQAGFVMGNYVYYGVDESAKRIAAENKTLNNENEMLKSNYELLKLEMEDMKKQIMELNKAKS